MKRIFDVLVFALGKICAVLLFAMIVVTTYQIIARDFLHLSTPWTEELARVFIIWITFLGGTRMLIRKEHLTVDFFSNMYTPSIRKFARVFNSCVYTFFSCFMLYSGYKLVTHPIIAKTLMPAMLISRNWQYSVMPICMILMLAFSVYELAISVKVLFQKNAEASTGGNNK